jgi:hypothetical protein
MVIGMRFALAVVVTLLSKEFSMGSTRWVTATLLGAISLAPLSGCESQRGGNKGHGTVSGGAGGAAAGATVAGADNRPLSALLGGALGAGGGYLIGAPMDKTDPQHRDEAVHAAKKAEANPARPEDVRRSKTADLNDDGFVTQDEVAAMQRAGLSDKEMIDRLRATGQVFELTAQQEGYLRSHFVGQRVIQSMRNLTQSAAKLASDAYDGGSGEDRRGSQGIGAPR